MLWKNALGEMTPALAYFQKADSVVQRNQFILPEIRSNDEELIFFIIKMKKYCKRTLLHQYFGKR